VRFSGCNVGVNYLVWLSQLGQLIARFLKQSQALSYMAGPALRPSHFLTYEGHQVLVTNGSGDPERVLEQWQRLIRSALLYQAIGAVVVRIGGIGRIADPPK
jgi:hypothetical protein